MSKKIKMLLVVAVLLVLGYFAFHKDTSTEVKMEFSDSTCVDTTKVCDTTKAFDTLKVDTLKK